MPSINIPEIHLPGIKKIAELPEEVIYKIYSFLEGQHNGVGVSNFISAFQSEFQDDQIAGAIYSFGQLLNYDDIDIKEIAENLTESYIELSGDDLDSSKKTLMNERLFNILSLSNFLIISNEAYKIASNFNSIIRTKISTDIRLIFSNSDYDKRNALLLHKLFIRFRYKDDYDSETYYMDNSDLKDLKSQIEASLIEEENIRKNNKDVLAFIEI